MVVEENSRSLNKPIYKLLVLCIKYAPFIITLFYILNTALCWLGIDTPVLSNITGVSFLTWLVLYLSAMVFKFCIYHKIFLYYILATDLINLYDFYFGIPIDVYQLLSIHSVITGVLIFSILYIYIRNAKSIKGDSTKNNNRYRCWKQQYN